MSIRRTHGILPLPAAGPAGRTVSARFFHHVLRQTAPLALTVLCVMNLACRPTERRFNNGFCSIGTEEVNSAFDHWFAAYTKAHPAAPAQPGPLHEGRGNATAPDALRRGICDLAPMTRPMTDAEVAGFVREFGAPPVAVPIAVEALVLVVPADSVLRTVSLAQIRDMYTRAPHALRDVFPEIDGSDQQERQLTVFGINSASDRYQWFKSEILQKHELSDRVREVPGPLELVDRVADSNGGVGYARPLETTNRVRTLALRVPRPAPNNMAFDLVEATEANIAGGRYPLARYYYVYLPPPGARPVDGRTLEFLREILGDAGQNQLRPLGLVPLSRAERDRSLASVARYR